MAKAQAQRFNQGSRGRAPRGAIWTVDGPQVYDSRTPLDILCDQEESAETDRRDVFSQAMGALFVDGPHPAMVMRHAYSLTAEVDPRLVRGLSKLELRAMCDANDWAHHQRIGQILLGTRVNWRSTAVHEREIQKRLRDAHAKLKAPTTERAFTPAELLQVQAGETVAEYRGRMEVIGGFLRFFFMSGPAPAKVVRRIYCVAKGVTPHHVLNMTLEDLGVIFGEVRATWSWRLKRVLNDFLKTCGAGAVKLAFQKSDEACAKYALAQLGNRNRRGGGSIAMSA